jgi:hypothetical protein
MDIRELSKRINENCQLMAEGRLSEIERDILLEDLRKIYLLAKGATPVKEEKVVVKPAEEMPAEVTPVISEPAVHIQEQKPIVYEEPKPEPAQISRPEPVIEFVMEQRPVTPREEPVAEKKEQVQLTMQMKEEPVIEIVEKEVSRPAASLNESFGGAERSLNERLSAAKGHALNDMVVRRDLKSMIDFNKQYVLTNELFKGDSQAFNTAISRINEAPNIEAAFDFIKKELLPKYKWSGEMQSARLFDKLVRQKFGL